MKLVVFGINMGNFYGSYALKMMTGHLDPATHHIVSFRTPQYASKYTHLPILDATPYIKLDWKQSQKWLEENVTSKYDEILFYFAPVFEDWSAGKERKIKRWFELASSNPHKGEKHTSSYLVAKIVNLVISSHLPVQHFISDPLEADYSQLTTCTEWCFYDIPGRASYHSYIEDAIAKQPGPLEKTVPFTFSFSNVSRIPFRTELYKQLKQLDIPFYYKGPEEDTLLEVDQYNTLLQHSKYTLIIPSYDTSHFSLIRYLEAEHRGCVPLIHPDCNLQYVEKRIKKEYILSSLQDLRQDKYN